MSINPVNEPLLLYLKSDRSSYSLSDPDAFIGDLGVFQDILLMHRISEQGIPYPLFEKIQEKGSLTLQEWADILGISSKTLTRYRKEEKVFQPWHSAVILQVTELLSLGMEVFEESGRLYSWLHQETYALGGRSPIDLLLNAYGRDLVLRELYALEHGNFA